MADDIQAAASDAELIAAYDDLEARFLAAKENRDADPEAYNDAKYELREARLYWRTVREAVGVEPDEGGVVVGPGATSPNGG